jgi:hypothetical protein
MSLAITAAPFDTDNQTQNYSELNSNDTPVNRKRNSTSSTHNKTQKRLTDMQFDPEKVNHVLQSIHNNNSNDNELGDFNPKRNQASATQSSVPINPLNTLNKLLAPPASMREKEDRKEGFHNNNEDSNNSIPSPLDNADMDLQELQSAFLNDTQVRDYYKKLVPNYNHKTSDTNSVNKTQPSNLGSGSGSGSGSYGGNDVLLNKINYMINLLEDQQDERTNNVTEEVVLYSFLGIFIIFVVDSFARVGKYTR